MTRPSAAPGAIPRRAWQVLAVTSVAVFMSFLDVTIVNIAFPDLRRDFAGTPLASLSWVLNAYTIVFAAALVPIGRWADRVGRRRTFLVGVVLFVLASAACGLAPTPELLVAARVVQALGAAALVPTSMALLLPEFPVERRATATAIWGATGAVAAATGPSLGGVLVSAGGWRWVFFVNLPIGLAALLPARRLLRETARNRGPRPDVVGAGLLAVGVGSLALGIVEGPSWGWTSGRVVGALFAAAVLLVAFGVRSGRHPVPAVDLRLFRVRSFAAANAGNFVFSLGFYALLLCNVLFLTGVWGWSTLRAGLALTPGPLTAAVLAPIAGRLSDRYGQRVVAVPGGLLFALGAALLAAAAPAQPDYVRHFLPAAILTGAGVGLSVSSLGSAAVAELPRTMFATGSAVTTCIRQIGAVIGIAVLLVILGDVPSLALFEHAWWAMAATGALAGLSALALGRVRARDVEELGPRVVVAGPPAAPAVEPA